MSALPYGMFDVNRTAAEARRLDRCENIYHRGQDLVWNGRETLAALVEKHGGVHVPPEKHAAMHAVFGPLMWGELAAWKISAQLADRLEPLGAKMAATSQAHDEARHFYVMHDYVELATGSVPKTIHRAAERLLGEILDADDLASKLLGMQLQVETSALTIFQQLRTSGLCPVLTDLLLYFEKDEARHVGLGTQYLPLLLGSMNRWQSARFTAFALRISLWLLASNRAMDAPMRALGIDPRAVMRLAKSKQMLVFEELWKISPKTGTTDAVSRFIEGAGNALWPPPDARGIRGRVQSFVSGCRLGIDGVATTIQPEVTPAAPPPEPG